MWMNTLRGTDSTGVAIMAKGNKKGEHRPELVKALGGPDQLLEQKRFDKALSHVNTLFMTHNRAATIAARTLQFAHPYQFEHVVGMHNGTVPLYNLKTIDPDAKSDSQTIIQAINDMGVEEVIPKIEGAWALVWYDSRDYSINFLRNSQRTLYFTFDDDRKNLFWSSEIEMLASACNRREIKRTDATRVFMCVPDKWYKWIIPDHGKPFEQSINKTVEGKKYTWQGNNNNRSSTVGGGSSNGHTPFQTKMNGSNGTKGPSGELFSDSVRKIIPHDAAERQIKKGKGKFTHIFRNDLVRIYIDQDTKEFHKYLWDPTNSGYTHFIAPWSERPAELLDVNVEETIKNQSVVIGRPFDAATGPDKNPPADTLGFTEALKFTGIRTLVKKRLPGTEDSKEYIQRPWATYKWIPIQRNWIVRYSEAPPFCIPDTLHDICASHQFKWRGKRDKRRVYYKGFNKKIELSQGAFNTLIMEKGCASCGRRPIWTGGRFGGVLVNFFSPTDFLCEYCGEDRELFKSLKEMYLQSESVKNFNDHGTEDKTVG